MEVENLLQIIGADFYTGVPDSQLSALCNYLMIRYGIDGKHHIIGANEGNCVAIAAGYNLATDKIPVIYLQNSGLGNIVNPVASLTNNNVYAIPQIFIIGWRGEPGIQDEPQHIYQGKITLKLLEDLDIKHFVISDKTSVNEVRSAMELFKKYLNKGKSVAFVIKKGALTYENKISYKNKNKLLREDVIEHILKAANNDIIIATTGKTGREVYEIRQRNAQSHKYDFLTVGSMGHCSSIALGVAINKPTKKIWCIDGDGALLMHTGALAVIGKYEPENLVHIVLNNGAHESVGGLPTAADNLDIAEIAKFCGYKNSICVDNICDLDRELINAKNKKELSLIEIKCAIGARTDLGRPKEKPIENKKIFMENLKKGVKYD